MVVFSEIIAKSDEDIAFFIESIQDGIVKDRLAIIALGSYLGIYFIKASFFGTGTLLLPTISSVIVVYPANLKNFSEKRNFK